MSKPADFPIRLPNDEAYERYLEEIGVAGKPHLGKGAYARVIEVPGTSLVARLESPKYRKWRAQTAENTASMLKGSFSFAVTLFDSATAQSPARCLNLFRYANQAVQRNSPTVLSAPPNYTLLP